MPLHVEIVSPEGDIAFLPGHAPFIGALGIAAVRVLLQQHGEQAAAVHGGFVEVNNDHVIVLSDVAELPEQIDVPRAQEAKARAEAALRADEHDEEAKAALARAETRLEVAGASQ